MLLGFVPLHPRGVRPEAGIQSPYKNRPAAYASAQAERRPWWGEYRRHSAGVRAHRRCCHLNTENNPVPFALLFYYFSSNCETLQNSGIGKNMGSPTCVAEPVSLFLPHVSQSLKRGRWGLVDTWAPAAGLCLHHPLVKPQKWPNASEVESKVEGFLHNM